MAATVTYVGTNTNTTGASTYTFTSEPVGAAAADRTTVVVVTGIQNSSTNSGAPTVTIGGSAATGDVTSIGANAGSARAIAGIYSRANPSGTTATIVVTFALAMFECVIYVYNVTGAGAVLNTASAAPANGSGAASGTLNVNTVTGGGVIAGTMIFDVGTAGPVSWTGVTSNANHVIYTADRRGAASANVATGATPRTVTVTYPEAISGSADSFSSVAVSYDVAAVAGGATKQMHSYRQRRV
jgi:hypothetical protein